MKKLLFFASGIFLCLNATAQQTEFGLTAGYSNLTIKSSFNNLGGSVSGSGLYIGFFADVFISENFHIQPSINYGNIENANLLFIPVMVKYYIGNSGFSLKAGPQATFNLEGLNGYTNLAGLDLALGVGYNITENLFLQARYAFELTNRIKEENFQDGPEPPKLHYNSFFAGIGFKF